MQLTAGLNIVANDQGDLFSEFGQDVLCIVHTGMRRCRLVVVPEVESVSTMINVSN